MYVKEGGSQIIPKNLNSGNIIHNEFVKYADIPQMSQLQI
jgi:hypothetical protein